jgi:hypothetical protein
MSGTRIKTSSKSSALDARIGWTSDIGPRRGRAVELKEVSEILRGCGAARSLEGFRLGKGTDVIAHVEVPDVSTCETDLVA